jgi:small subunit ribosomal protein S6
MFLINQAQAADFGGVIDHIRQILTRAGAEIIAMSKWDERRLAFDIQKQRRGIFILTYFSCTTTHLVQIERSCNLSDRLMRTMIVRADHLTIDEMQATDAAQALKDEAVLRARQAAEAAERGVPAGAREPDPAPEVEREEVEAGVEED